MNNLKTLRTAKGLSQKKLAEKVECSQPTIWAIEQGGGTNLRLALRIAKTLGKPVAAVFPK